MAIFKHVPFFGVNFIWMSESKGGGTRRENGGTHASSCPFVLIHMSAIVSMLAASMLAGAIAIVPYGTVQNCMISTHWFKSQD